MSSEQQKETQVFNAASLLEAQKKSAPETESQEEAQPDPMTIDTQVKVEEPSPTLTHLSLMTKLTSGSPSAYRMLLVAAEDLGAHTINAPEQVTLTSADKLSFLDAFLDNKPWTSQCEAMNGKLQVQFRCRTVAQTSAIHAEMQRRFRGADLEAGMDFNTALLSSFLYFQLTSLNSTRYEEPPTKESELFASTAYNPETDRYESEPPAWYTKARALTRDMSEAKLRILLNLLAIFETKYWELSMNIDTADFWNPED